ncbi:MAG TPA: DUF5658 family protein [Acidobacteriota bacterium]|nr:DUF5658 family protein [Acidobacteriota bacterium]
MKRKMIPAVIAAVLILSAGFAGAKEIEFTLIGTAAVPMSSFFSPEVMSMAAPIVAAPVAALVPIAALSPALPVNILRPQGFGGSYRGEELENALFTTSLVAMTALNVADYISTRQALKYPGLSESNPLMKPFVKNAVLFAAVKAGTTVLSVWGMKSLFKRDKRMAWVLTTASNFLLSYIVANNMKLVSRMRPR